MRTKVGLAFDEWDGGESKSPKTTSRPEVEGCCLEYSLPNDESLRFGFIHFIADTWSRSTTSPSKSNPWTIPIAMMAIETETANGRIDLRR